MYSKPHFFVLKTNVVVFKNALTLCPERSLNCMQREKSYSSKCFSFFIYNGIHDIRLCRCILGSRIIMQEFEILKAKVVNFSGTGNLSLVLASEQSISNNINSKQLINCNNPIYAIMYISWKITPLRVHFGSNICLFSIQHEADLKEIKSKVGIYVFNFITIDCV